MKVKVICTFPEYSAIFLNKKSKQLLLNHNNFNELQPKYQKKYGHHATLTFKPGQPFNIRYASLVALKVVKHIYDDYCQLIEVVPVSITYRSLESEAITLTDEEEMIQALGGHDNVPSTLYITVSTAIEDSNGQKINHEYSESMLDRLNNGDNSIVSEDIKDDYILHGFVGMRCDAIIENNSIKKIDTQQNQKRNKNNYQQQRNNNHQNNYQRHRNNYNRGTNNYNREEQRPRRYQKRYN